MKKFFKLSAILCAVVMVLIIAAIFVVFSVADPNDYKEEIAGAVHKATGRDLSIQGNIDLSVFPWLGLKLGSVTLGNAPLFGKSPMAKVQNADIKLGLIPLLRKKLDIKRIVLSGLDVSLIREKDGKTNWDDLAGKFGKKEQKPEKPGEQGSEDILGGLVIAGLELTNVRISFDDRTRGTYHQISNLNLSSGQMKLGKPCKLNLQFNIDSANPEIRAGVNLRTVMNLLVNEKQADFDKTELSVVADEFNPDQQNKESAISGTADLAGNLLVKWGTGDFRADDLRLKTAIKGGQIPEGAADLDLKAGVNLNWKKETLDITGLDFSGPDKLTIRGALSMADFKQPKIRFDLTAGETDINKYVPKKGNKIKNKPDSGKGKPTKAFQIPDASGTLRIAGIRAGETYISDLFLNIDKGQKNKDSGKLNLKFNVASAKPEIQAGIDISALVNLLPGRDQLDMKNTRLALRLDKFVPDQQDKDSALAGSASLGGDMLVNWGAGSFRADDLKLKTSIRGAQIPGGSGNLDLKTRFSLNWKKETLTISGLDLSAYDMRITGNANADRLFSKPHIKSALDIAEFSPKRLLQRLGATVPGTKDPNALNKASASIGLNANQNLLNLSKLNIMLDQTALRGSANIANFRDPKIKFDLEVNKIDIDRYLPPKPKNAKEAKEAAEKIKDLEPPERLGSLDIDGRLVVDNLKIFKIRSQDTVVRITAKDGLFQVDPFSAKLYGGEYTSRITANLKEKTPVLPWTWIFRMFSLANC